jgi:hypothetical protein
MSLRLSLLLALAAAGCVKQAPQSSTPKPMFDVSRICDNPHYQSICEEKQAPAAFPAAAPIRIDTNFAAPRATKLALQG